jgi:RNA:NAD 2'-phosphotransferase (TPT1/KptA family)
MRKIFYAALALAVICTTFAVAQDQGQDRHDQQAKSNSHRVTKTNASGWIRKDGDNYVLENDKDQQRYRIQNTEAVRAHEGHHVKVNGRLHEDDRSLEVRSVKMIKASKKRDHQ